MNMRFLLACGLAGCGATTAFLVACASDTPTSPGTPEDAGSLPDASADGSFDSGDEAPCADCEFFPKDCEGDLLCPNGPYDPGSPASLDMRAQLNTIRGRSANDVWTVGAVGSIAHFDGTSWKASELGARETLRAIWLRDDTEVSFGSLSNIYTRGITIGDPDASAPSPGGWSARGRAPGPPEYSPSDTFVTSAWSAAGSPWLWCSTTTWDSGATSGLWRLQITDKGNPEVALGISPYLCAYQPCSQLNALHGSSAEDLFAVGVKGSAVRISDASAETPKMTVTNTQTWDALNGVWMASATEAWAVGTRGTIRHFTNKGILWDIVSDVPTTEDLRAVWGTSPTDVWAVGNAGVALHYDGNTWTRVKIAGLGARRPNLTTVWSAAPGHVWIGGHGVILSLGGKP